MNSNKTSGAKLWFLVWALGLAGQICWNMENQWFNTFVYAKIGKDPAIITGMLIASAAATTFSTFFFGTWSDRLGKRRHFIAAGYILWGIFTIAFGLTQFIDSSLYVLAGTMVVVAFFIESQMPVLMATKLLKIVPNVKWAIVMLSLFSVIISKLF